MQIKAVAKDYVPDVEIYGKMSKPYFPREGELSTRAVAMGLAKITSRELPINFGKADENFAEVARNLPARPPILCAGCPHRASLYVMKKRVENYSIARRAAEPRGRAG